MITEGQFGGSCDLWTTPTGNDGISVGISNDLNSHWFMRGTCPNINPVPTGLGEWFSVTLGKYQLGSGSRLDRGVLTVTVTHLGADVRGTFTIVGRNSDTSGVFRTSSAPCEERLGKPVLTTDVFDVGVSATGDALLTSFGIASRAQRGPRPSATGSWPRRGITTRSSPRQPGQGQ